MTTPVSSTASATSKLGRRRGLGADGGPQEVQHDQDAREAGHQQEQRGQQRQDADQDHEADGAGQVERIGAHPRP